MSIGTPAPFPDPNKGIIPSPGASKEIKAKAEEGAKTKSPQKDLAATTHNTAAGVLFVGKGDPNKPVVPASLTPIPQKTPPSDAAKKGAAATEQSTKNMAATVANPPSESATKMGNAAAAKAAAAPPPASHSAERPSFGRSLSMQSVLLYHSPDQLKALAPTDRADAIKKMKETQLQLSAQADLKTAQGLPAQMHALTVQQSITSAAANATSVGIDNVLNTGPQAQAPGAAKQTFKAMTGALGDALKDANITNAQGNPKVAQEDCHMLNNLAGLMQKGFQPKGGAGCFQEPGWDPSWSKLGKDPNAFRWDAPTDLTFKDAGFTLADMQRITGNANLTEADLGKLKLTEANLKSMSSPDREKVNAKVEANNKINAAKNAELQKSFQGMLKYFETNADKHFDTSTRTVAGVSIAAVQLTAVLGQLIHDYVLESGEPSGDRLLKPKMADPKYGLLDAAKFEGVKKLENAMRANPLLAEIPNELIKKEIVEELQKPNSPSRLEMLKLIKDEIDPGPNHKLPEDTRNKLAERILNNYISEIRNVTPTLFASGDRGRAPVTLLPLESHIAGAKSNMVSIAEQPNRGDDGFATDQTKQTLGANAKVKTFHDNVEGGARILTIGGSPEKVLRLGKGLDSGLRENLFERPAVLLKKAITATINENEGARQADSAKRQAEIAKVEAENKQLIQERDKIADPTNMERIDLDAKIHSNEGIIKGLKARNETRNEASSKADGTAQLQTYVKGLEADDSGLDPKDPKLNTDLQATKENPLNQSQKTNQALRKAMGQVSVPFNKAKTVTEKIPLRQFATAPTVAGIMQENDLRTICSISGTTVDAVVGMMAKKGIGEEKMKKVLQPLHDHAVALKEWEDAGGEKSGRPPPTFPDTPDGRACKQMISEISLFMHTGKYHTQGEVIGGLFIASRALICSPEENRDFNHTYGLFECLARDFKRNPVQYNAVDPNDKAAILNPANVERAEKAFTARNAGTIAQHAKDVGGMESVGGL